MTQQLLVTGPPYHFCTYFDRNYLTRALALYESLREHCQRPFTLWTLCFDDESYAILYSLALEGMRLIPRADFEAGDTELAAARANRSAVEYYWTCTPSLLLYVLRQDPGIDVITYLDADLLFFSDPQPIVEELGDSSILIVPHGYAPEYVHLADSAGIYNVSLLSFRSDHDGLTCLRWWRDRCNEWCYAHMEQGRFGDQKYLDDWPARFSNVRVSHHPGAGLAPWNLTARTLAIGPDSMLVNDYPLIFFHFHALRILSRRVIRPAPIIYDIPSAAITTIFLPYLDRLGNIATAVGVPFVDAPVNSTVWTLLRGLLSQEFLLSSPAMLRKLLWRVGGRARRAIKGLEPLIGTAPPPPEGARWGTLLSAIYISPLILFSRPLRRALAAVLSPATPRDH